MLDESLNKANPFYDEQNEQIDPERVFLSFRDTLNSLVQDAGLLKTLKSLNDNQDWYSVNPIDQPDLDGNLEIYLNQPGVIRLTIDGNSTVFISDKVSSLQFDGRDYAKQLKQNLLDMGKIIPSKPNDSEIFHVAGRVAPGNIEYRKHNSYALAAETPFEQRVLEDDSKLKSFLSKFSSDSLRTTIMQKPIQAWSNYLKDHLK